MKFCSSTLHRRSNSRGEGGKGWPQPPCYFWYLPSNRAVSYSNEVHRVVKEAVYGKFMQQIRTMRANSNGDNLFWSSIPHMENYKVQLAAFPPSPILKITCYMPMLCTNKNEKLFTYAIIIMTHILAFVWSAAL